MIEKRIIAEKNVKDIWGKCVNLKVVERGGRYSICRDNDPQANYHYEDKETVLKAFDKLIKNYEFALSWL